jgi:hypothetical protein
MQLHVHATRCPLRAVCALLVVLAAILGTATPASAAINKSINFQGRLTDASGTAVPDGTYNMEFKLHNHATNGGGAQGACSGSCLWMETRTGASKVQVTRGLFSVQLGDVASLAAFNFNQDPIYLSVQVGGSAGPTWDGEMGTRHRLGAAPTAHYAADADLLDGQTGSYYTNAGNLTGTVADARLSSNVALKNQDNNFSTGQTITGAVTLPTTGSSGGLVVGGDTNLYRSAADILATDDSFRIGAANDFWFGTDTRFYRGSAGLIRTPGSLTVDGTILAGAGGDITCSNCLNAGDLAADSVADSELADNITIPGTLDVQGRLRTPDLAGAPSSPVEGEIYYNTTDDRLYVYADGSWKSMGGAGVGGTGINFITPVTVATHGNGNVAWTMYDVSTQTGGVVPTHAILSVNLAGTTGSGAWVSNTYHFRATGSGSVPVVASNGIANSLGGAVGTNLTNQYIVPLNSQGRFDYQKIDTINSNSGGSITLVGYMAEGSGTADNLNCASCIQTAEIQDGEVRTADIQDGTITAADLNTLTSGINGTIASGSTLWSNKLNGADAQPAARWYGDGTIEWGAGGASAPDTNLYRTGASSLRTDDHFTAVGGLNAGRFYVAPGNTGATMTLAPGAASPEAPEFQYGDGTGWKLGFANVAGTRFASIEDTGTIRAAGSIIAGTTPDIAETIHTAGDVEAADVVKANPDRGESVVTTKKPYDSAAVGVISDGTSAFIINAYAKSDTSKLNGKPLVLAGRVPVKVTDEGGPIRPGDDLTSSSTPGHAMRATRPGPTIGKALGSFDGSRGKVLALINASSNTADAPEMGTDFGANLPVLSGARSMAVRFAEPRSSTRYAATVTPGWRTPVWITDKSRRGFVIHFDSPKSDSALDWHITDSSS